jgi:NitT/TauT family transport system ATP-binding protein/nitrate/nitrite transport system substrate-binding protein
MSDVVSLAALRKGAPARLRIGLLRLSDGAPVIIAHEFGFFAEEGIETELLIEPSWANIADKLAYGFLDAAVILPPLAFALTLGLRGPPQPMVIPYIVSGGGNTVTVSRALAEEGAQIARRDGLSTLRALANCLRGSDATLGIVHAYSTHNLLLRYWLAAAGIEAGRDVRLTVVPPARVVEALSARQIVGFCAGAPWGEVARRAALGITVATSYDIWQHAPEKALALRADWSHDHPETQAGVMRALLRAAKFCDDPENASYIAAVLSRRRYLDVDSHTILAGLPGTALPERGSIFYRGAVSFPWRSQALWFLAEMRRWKLIESDIDLRALAARVYRPDLYRAAFAPLGESIPAEDWKCEGAHDAPWSVDGLSGTIALPADRFCDGAVFDPDAVPIRAPAAQLHKL